MPIPARQSSPKEFTQAPKGRHQFVCIGVVDRGEQPNKYKDNKLEHKISFHFEIAAVDENGNRFEISKWVVNNTFFSAKTGMMSGLVEMLTQWLDMDAGEIGPAVFDDLECLAGLNGRMRIVHKQKEDGSGVKAVISSLEPWTDGDGPALQPSTGVGDGPVFPGKNMEQFLEEISGGVANLGPASAPTRPTPAPVPTRQPDAAARNRKPAPATADDSDVFDGE
jgi:hypothetical protein